MAFKLEINQLDITNYPFLEAHFEQMAKNGWMIDKVFGVSIFIYKKIRPQDMNFSITPFENKTPFLSLSEELFTFQDICKSKGWNMALQSEDFHVCYKQKETKAQPLIDSPLRKFRAISSIAKKQLIFNFMKLFFFLYYLWWIGFNNIPIILQSGLIQIFILCLPFLSIAFLSQMIRITWFTIKNRKLRSDFKYLPPLSYMERFIHGISYFLCFLLILYSVYKAWVFANPFAFIIMK